MKKSNKNTLLKAIIGLIIVAVLLTWITPSATFTEGQYSAGDFERVGIFDLSTYSLMSFNYFSNVFAYLFILAGFSMFLGRLDAFKKLVKGIASKLKGKELAFLIGSLVFYGVLASIIKDSLVLLIFAPFTIAIMTELKQSKINTFIASFGGILLGTLSSTYNGTVAAILKQTFTGIKNYNPELIVSIALFVLGGALLVVLSLQDSKKKNFEETENILESKSTLAEKVKARKVSTLPLIIIGVLVSLISVLSMIDWSGMFGVTAFTDLATQITESTIGGVTVFKYLFGQTSIAFGEWTLYLISGLLVINTLILAVIYRVKFDEVIDSYLDGFKAYAKPILAVFLIYVVFETAWFFPTLATVYNWILNTFGDNSFTWIIVSMIGSIFATSYEYLITPLSGFFTTVGTNSQEVVALATQLGSGLISFVAPTSIFLALGLSILNIDYKKYLKFIWKFFAAMFVISILVLIILVHIA